MTTRTRSDAERTSGRPAPAASRLTFVFTDIEGSTRLLEQLRDRYADVLATHGRLIGEAATRAGGELVDTQGDSFFLVFATADQAVAFATAAQRALEKERWPAESTLRVRMGIHSGEATANAGGYVGLDVHRAARISSAAHGGQVLLSPEAARGLANGARLKDIGSHGLKDFAQPIVLHQLVVDGLPDDFPPPRIFEEPDQPPAEGEPPYQGLAHFEEDDAARFFGREKIVERLVARLAEQPFLAVIGASGSGKSSVVRAGLIPALREMGVSRVVLLTPTAEPMSALAAALAASPQALRERLGPDSLLVVDQAEELFSLCRDEGERAAFIERVLSAAEAGGKVVLTLRADFYDRLAGYPQLRDLVAARQEYLGQMSPAELRAAITGPAEADGWRFDAGLVDLILHDVGTEPGALPLLSHALLETWQRRRGRLMMLRGYLESGGVQGAIARSADRLMAELEPEQQAIARTIFLRLTEFGAGTPDTRRRAGLDELVGRADARGAAEVLQRLAEHRLVVLGTDTAEVAHEALIREWPTLREWLAADREALRLHRGLTEAAGEWQRAGREPSLLYRGARLAGALDWAPSHAAELNVLEREFIEASRLASEREAQRQRTINRRLRFLLAGAGVFLLVAISAGVYAALEAGRAEQEAAAALAAQLDAEGARRDAEAARLEAEENAAEAERQEQLALDETRRAEDAAREARAHALYASTIVAADEDPELAILLFREARLLRVDPPMESVTALHRAFEGARVLASFDAPESEGSSCGPGVAISADGDTVYMTADGSSIHVFDVSSQELLETLGRADDRELRGLCPALSLDQDGNRLGTVDIDGTIHLWDLEQRTADSWSVPGYGPGAVIFSPDPESPYIVVQSAHDEARSAAWNLLTVWNVTDRSRVLRKRFEAAVDVAFHPNGRRLIVTDCACDPESAQVLYINIETRRTRTAVENIAGVDDTRPQSAAISPSGELIATGGESGNTTLWSSEGTRVDVLPGHTDWVTGVKFSPTDDRLATWSLDGTVNVWDLETRQVDLTLRGHGGEIGWASFSADGSRLVTGSSNQTARVWDIGPADSEVAGYEFEAAFEQFWYIDHEADTLAVFGGCFQDRCHSSRHFFDTSTGVRSEAIDLNGYGVALTPDGQYFLSQLRVQHLDPADIARLSELHPQVPPGDFGAFGPLRISPVWSDGGIVELEGVCPMHRYERSRDVPPETVYSETSECDVAPHVPWEEIAWRFTVSDDGTRFAHLGDALATWDSQGQLLAGPIMPEFGIALDLSPDGRLLAVTASDRVTIYETDTLEIVSSLPVAWASSLQFSPDGATLAVSSQGPTRVYEVGTWTYQQFEQSATALDFSGDGSLMATLERDGAIRLWTTETEPRLLHAIPLVRPDVLAVGDGRVGHLQLISDKHVATADQGRLRVLTMDADELLAAALLRVNRDLTAAERDRFDISRTTTP